MINKYKELLKNIGIFGISNLVTKIILFLMIPLYTNVLSSSEYGIIDIISTTINLAIPIFTLCITEAVIRYTMEKITNKKQVLITAFRVVLIGFIILNILSIIAMFLGISIKYVIIFLSYYIVLAINNILAYYLRGIEKVKELGLISIIRVIILVCLNLLLLLYFNTGVIGYYLSLIISDIIAIISFAIIIKKDNKMYHDVNEPNISKEMINYSKPFIANSISWWINNASDKYVLLLFCNIETTGIYSISYKIPSILEMIQNVFAQAWQISAIKEYKDKKSSIFFENMYKYYNIILVFSVCFLLLFLKVISKILFAKEFYTAWQYVPFLLLAILFGALSGFLGSIYAAYKDSKMYAKSTIIGAIINIFLNFILIPILGATGAAFATFLSYLLIWVIRLKFMKKYITLKINFKKDITAYIILIIDSLIIIINYSKIILLISNLISIMILIILYYNEIKFIIKKIFNERSCKK